MINFWYLNCPPCRLENPEFEKLYQQFHSQGFNIIAIDKGDPFTPVASYKVSTFPETYVLDADGHIVYRAVGSDINALRQALAKLGFK